MNLIWSPAHMAVFAKVVDMNGFSAAARALKVPKAAVSRSISQLESELGLKLLERTTRRLHLTPAGEVLLPHCRRILGECDAVRETALLLGTQHGGTLRVRGDATWGRVLLTPLVPRFLERFSDIPLDVEPGRLRRRPRSPTAGTSRCASAPATTRRWCRACWARRRHCCAQRRPTCRSAARQQFRKSSTGTTC